MFNLFFRGGDLMWILLLLTIIIVVLSVKKAFELFGNKEYKSVQLENGINAILFWGIISAVLGFFGHYLGIYEAMMAISVANDISPAIVAAGYGVSLITILSGLNIFMISAIIWFVLRWKYKKVVEQSA